MLWFQLLQLQRRRQLTGFTFSFLIGARRHVQGSTSPATGDFGDLCDLLIEMQRHTPQDHYIGVAYCGQLLQPVAATYRRHIVPNSYGLHPVVRPGAATSLYASNAYNPDGTVDAMATTLWGIVGTHIEAGNYSVVNRLHVPFTADDIADIERACRVA
jgi:hypothetical protein